MPKFFNYCWRKWCIGSTVFIPQQYIDAQKNKDKAKERIRQSKFTEEKKLEQEKFCSGFVFTYYTKIECEVYKETQPKPPIQ